MKVLHIEPRSEGYEVVEFIANRVSSSNGLRVIEKHGKRFMTGGFILNDTPQIRSVLDNIPPEEQYQFVCDFRLEPFVKFYFED